MSQYYNAMHAPVGAHASFTLGCKGQNGGLGLELGGPAYENIYIGVQSRDGRKFEALPFFVTGPDDIARYDHARAGKVSPQLHEFPERVIRRDYTLCSDEWKAGDLQFTVYSPAWGVPDPERSSVAAMKQAVCPAVLAELTIDNRKCKKERIAFFGYQPQHSNDAVHRNNCGAKTSGIGIGQQTAVFTDTPGVVSATGFDIMSVLQEDNPENLQMGLGAVAALKIPVPAQKKVTVRLAICFFRGGIVTTGLSCSYYYQRYFKDIAQVGLYALRNFQMLRQQMLQSGKQFNLSKLNPAQKFQFIHATRCFYGSTQFLDHKGKPLWVVNEGEYRMMNTFDLFVDHLFYELKLHPWTVKNRLDLFVDQYSYKDKLHFPGGENAHSGGLAFTHDMGQKNHFSRKGYSAYELTGLSGCFSYMSQEQVVNWVLCAACYLKKTADRKWLRGNQKVMLQCLQSMLRRDHPVDRKRNGVMSLDSSRTGDGAEITTYDSLDSSLGQSRENTYLAVKCWASYLALADIFESEKMAREVDTCMRQADRCAETILRYKRTDGTIPALLNDECESLIIPTVEGLVFPYYLGQKEYLQRNGRYGALICALKDHIRAVMKEGICLYPDGGWKLSSTTDNSWLSKIYLCQFVAQHILGAVTKKDGLTADNAHMNWLLKEENRSNAWSDQMSSGVAKGSLYYPRGVTAILWLGEPL